MASRLDEFFIGLKPQREWGWLVITYLFLGGAGAGLYLISLYVDHVWAGVLGMLVLLLGTLMLFLDLGRPERFWRAFSRPWSSWISRGCFFITILFVFGSLELLSRFQGASLVPGGSETALKIVASVAALLVMVYTGFVLSPSSAIPFWNSAFFPIVFLLYSLLAGADLLILASPFLPGPPVEVVSLEKIQIYLGLACLVLILSHISVMSGSATAARESIRLLTRGKWAVLFIGGVIVAGLVIPLAFGWPMLWQSEVQTIFALTAVMALLRLFGDYLFRFLVIRVGMYDPLL